jgi:hypothetical protein
MPTPDADLVAKLDTELATLTAGTNLFSGPLRPVSTYIPTKCVFILSLPGGSILNYCDDSRTPQLYDFTMRVIIRGNAQDYSDGLTLARSVRDVIHDNPPSGYIATRVLTAEPVFFGYDDDGSHLFGIDVEMLYST